MLVCCVWCVVLCCVVLCCVVLCCVVLCCVVLCCMVLCCMVLCCVVWCCVVLCVVCSLESLLQWSAVESSRVQCVDLFLFLFFIILTSPLYSSLTFHLNLFSVFYSPHSSSPLILSFPLYNTSVA